MEKQFDYIVIGSGAGGSAAAYKLAMSGAEVLLIEQGEMLPRDGSTLDIGKVVHEGAFKTKEAWRNGDGRVIVPEEYANLGGKTKWYGAALLRFGRGEFNADPVHQCLAFPIGYDDLAPYYDEAEILLGVREFAREPDLRAISARLQPKGWRFESLPLGLAADMPQYPDEARHFDGFASVRGLKHDAEASLLARVRNRQNFTLVTGRRVTTLLPSTESPTRVTGVVDHQGMQYRGRHVLLALGALHSPRLLQSYFDETGLDGLAVSANLGANLKLHLLTAMLAVSPSVKNDLLRKTALFVNEHLPHSSVQPLGFDGELMGTLVPKFVPRPIARAIGNRAYGFFLQTEDGSHPGNRVTGATGGELPQLDYDATRLRPALAEHRALVRTLTRHLFASGFLAFAQRIPITGTAHACGTLVAGRDPAKSVVDENGRVHGFGNLYVVDGSVLARSSRVNPALTIYAWALRVAHHLTQRKTTHDTEITGTDSIRA